MSYFLGEYLYIGRHYLLYNPFLRNKIGLIYNYVWDVTIWNVQYYVIAAFHYVKCLYLHVLYRHTVCFLLQMDLIVAAVGLNFTIIPKNTIILDRSMCAGDLVYYLGEFSI